MKGSDRLAQRRQIGLRGRFVGGIVARDGKDRRIFPIGGNHLAIIRKHLRRFALVHHEQDGDRVTTGEAIIREQFGHLIFFGGDEKDNRLGPAKGAIGLGVMRRLVAVQIGSVHQDHVAEEIVRGLDHNQRIALAADGQIGRQRERGKAEPVFGDIAGFCGDGDGAGGEGSAKAGGGKIRVQQAVDQGALSGSGAAEDADDQGVLIFSAEVEQCGGGIGTPAVDGGCAGGRAVRRAATFASRDSRGLSRDRLPMGEVWLYHIGGNGRGREAHGMPSCGFLGKKARP